MSHQTDFYPLKGLAEVAKRTFRFWNNAALYGKFGAQWKICPAAAPSLAIQSTVGKSNGHPKKGTDPRSQGHCQGAPKSYPRSSHKNGSAPRSCC